MRLSLRLVLAFVTVATVAVGTAALVVGLTTTSRFERFATEVRRNEASLTAERLGEAYSRTGDLREAAEEVLRRGQPRGLPMAVVDTRGKLVWGTRGIGSRAAIAAWPATPLVAAGEQIGQLHMPRALASGGIPPDASDTRARLERTFVDETVRSLLIGLGIALAVALAVGVVIAAGITRPLRRLTAAARGVEAGDLGARSGLAGRDELATVGAAFDDMAAGLQAQEAARRNLFADIAHELRTPVTVIEGNLQAMLDGVYDRSDETLQSTLDRAQGLHRLVEDIRDLSLADVGKLHLSIERVSLERVLGDATSAMRGQVQAKGVALELAPASEAAMADEARLRQVLANLLDNAVRHTPPGGAITLRSGSVGAGSCWIEVSDTGEGVSAEDLPHIFDRFYRGTDASGRKTRGSGLGLAIARALITAMGGQLTAASTPSEGSTFRIELPAANEGRGTAP